MKVVLTNDDGIGAPGLAALITIISEIAAPVVVAPPDRTVGCGPPGDGMAADFV